MSKHEDSKNKGSQVDPAASSDVGNTERKKGGSDQGAGGADRGTRIAMFVTIAGIVLIAIISFLIPHRNNDDEGESVAMASSAEPKTKKLLGHPSESKKITGERKFEASGAVAVPGAGGILFVDDSKAGHVFFMPVNELGEQGGDVQDISLGVHVANPEAISRFGSKYVMVSSLSTEESNDTGGIAMFDFDPTTHALSNAIAVTGLRKFLLDKVTDLKPWASKLSAEGGLNIEGVSGDPDPQHPRLLLGLRGPLSNGKALVVSISLRDAQAPLSLENIVLDDPNAIRLDLKGQAIRDIQYDSRLKGFLIISGAPETEKKTDFTLWFWNGDRNQSHEDARPREQTTMDKKMKPEGITPLKIGNSEFVFIVGDANSYARIDYNTH